MTKGYGFTVYDIDWSSPADLEPYSKAYQIRRNEKDILQWQLGQYMAAAVSCIFPKGKYPDKPIFQIEKETTAEEIQKQRELFIAKMQAMKANFDLNK